MQIRQRAEEEQKLAEHLIAPERELWPCMYESHRALNWVRPASRRGGPAGVVCGTCHPNPLGSILSTASA